MNLKKLIIAAVAGVFVVPAMASAYTSTGEEYAPATETLVEGHTVFAIIQATLCIDNYGEKGTDANGDPYDNEKSVKCPNGGSPDFDVSYDVRANITVQRLGTAVAVLVRDRVKEYVAPPTTVSCMTNRDVVSTILYENPGVLWFNDQFLVGDDLDILETDVDANVDVCNKEANIVFDKSGLPWRYPCGGWVLATQGGNPDPRDFMSQWQYTESYQIIDPNDHTWTIDKYSLLPAGVGVTIPATDVSEDLGLDDDDGPASAFDEDDDADGDLRAVVAGPGGSSTMSYHLGRFNMWSVPVMGLDVEDDGPTSGCTRAPHADERGGDRTDRLYNAVLFFFFEDLVVNGAKVHGAGAPDDGDLSGCEEGDAQYDCADGDDAEGNSHPYNAAGNGSGPVHAHATASADLYFSNIPPPAPPALGRVFAIFDTVGSGAPSHAHGAEPFDDRVRFSACGDLDRHRYEEEQTFNGDGTWEGTGTYETDEPVRHGEGESFPGDGDNLDDCTGGYDGGTTGWDPSGAGEDGSTVPDEESY